MTEMFSESQYNVYSFYAKENDSFGEGLFKEEGYNDINLAFEKEIKDAKVDEKARIRSKYNVRKHRYFVKTCLAPFGYKKGHGEVFACIRECSPIDDIEGKHDRYYMNISLLTPAMAYTDSVYFSGENKAGSSIWWMKEYKPFFYEFKTEINVNDVVINEFVEGLRGFAEEHLRNYIKRDETKSSDRYDSNASERMVWFTAKLTDKPTREGEFSIKGVMTFGGSPSYAEELWLGDMKMIKDDRVKEAKKLFKTYQNMKLFYHR